MPTTPSEADDDALPVPVEPRTYIKIQPSNERLVPDQVELHVRQLSELQSPDEPSLLSRLPFRSATPPTIEVLLVTDGDPDGSLSYLLGVDGDNVEALEQICRGLFPDTYEFERVTRTPKWLHSIREEHDEDTVAGVEYQADLERAADWQTKLTPFEAHIGDEGGRIPLASVAEHMANSIRPMIYQALVRPKPDWTRAAEDRMASIELGDDTFGGSLSNLIFGQPEERTLYANDKQRLEELEAKDAARSFDVNARVVTFAGDASAAETAIRPLTGALAGISRTSYSITGTVRTGSAATELFTDMCDREFRTGVRWPISVRSTTRAGIVADPAELASFWVLGGDALTSAGARAVASTPGEQTALPTPAPDQLAAYRGAGLALGRPLSQDGTPDSQPLVLPPALQPMHVAWFGKTGSGKSTGLINGLLANHAATDGADILIDPKGDGMATEYLRAHYATYGTLENVLYFDCADVLPAFSFFDIRDELAAGVSRTTAVEDLVDHYLEILTQIMGADRFEQAVRSPDIIRYLTKACFDPVNGTEAFPHRHLHERVRQMHERQTAPAVSDPDLERMLAGVVANQTRSFDEIMQGVANRIEKIPVDRRLARVFNHSPDSDGADPRFDLADYLDEDVVVIFDTGGLRTEAQRVLTLVVLSNLWTALRRRTQRGEGDHPLVNLYLEEAASVAVTDLLTDLLAQSRSFDCSVTLAMQFPGQLRDLGGNVYEEVLNNISTFVTGNVAVDKLLARRLATDDMETAEVGNRLRGLRRGEWLVSLPAAFDEPEPRPFLLGSLPLPRGDPDGPQPLSTEDVTAFEQALTDARERTKTDSGLSLTDPQVARQAEPDGDSTEEEGPEPGIRTDSALPHTNRMPRPVSYDESLDAIRCRHCENRYNPDSDGMRRAIECCSSLEAVDRHDVPICDLNLKLTPDERRASEWSAHQLMFLQAVYNAQQLRYDPLEYDLLRDSMIRLQEYVDVESAELEALMEADLLRHDTDHPHRLFSVTPAGRDAIGESYREGLDYGHGQGDLEESSQHVHGVEVARHFLVEEYVDDPDSRVTAAKAYYDLDENRRLDLAGVDADGEIVVTVEVERVNNDLRRAAPEDFDKMADCDPEEAIWVVMTGQAGHKVLSALNDPLEGPIRVAKTYSETTPPQQFRLDTPGATAIYPVKYVQGQLSLE